MQNDKFFLIEVEDTVIQRTTYVVKAENSEEAARSLEKGWYEFESQVEVLDTVSSEIKDIRELGSEN